VKGSRWESGADPPLWPGMPHRGAPHFAQPPIRLRRSGRRGGV